MMSKVKKKCEVIPPDLTQVAPAESISIDFAVYKNQDIMVIKIRSTGYISAVLCKDQKAAESVKALMTCFHSYGFCHILRSDYGGSFRGSFTEEMSRLGVKHVKASAYNSCSNGGAKRVLLSIKEYLG